MCVCVYAHTYMSLQRASQSLEQMYTSHGKICLLSINTTCL